MDTWLIYMLTGASNGGIYVTDVSNASRTNLMDIKSRQWHSETCAHFSLEADMLPEIRSNAEVFGHVKDGPLKGMHAQLCQTANGHDNHSCLSHCLSPFFPTLLQQLGVCSVHACAESL